VRSISKTIALFCLALTLWLGFAFVAHHHSSSADAVACSVCLSVHSASPKPPALSQIDFAFVSVLRAGSVSVSAKQRLVSFALSVRPPPEA
jgi:hypothetical protein